MEGHNIPKAMVINSSKQTLPGLLHLPPHVRERIYRQLRMIEWRGYIRSFDLHGRNSPHRPSPSRFYGLLLCCRTIYTEAAALLYSTNRFLIHYSDPGSLKPLHALTTTSLASLTRLKVILNQASCHGQTESVDGGDCCHDWFTTSDECDGRARCRNMPYHSGQHRHPLASCAPFDYGDGWQTAQPVLDEWEAAVAYMSPHISAGQLQLSLVCDIDHEQQDSIDIGKRVVAPLQLLPRLKDCSVRLCALPARRLWRLAQDAVLQARRVANPYHHPSPALTTLTTLPRELRLRILEYTDLITPHREVVWTRRSPAYIVYERQCLFVNDEGECSLPNHHGCQFFRCLARMSFPSDGCFCRRRHSAFSSECSCWAPPGPALFLVCRTLCQDARLVFFSGNRFIVGDMGRWMCNDYLEEEPSVWLGGIDTQAAGSYPYDRFAVSQFVRETVPVHCLAYIRFLELVFPPYSHRVWPRPEHPAMKDWCATVDWLKDKANGPRLTVRIVMTDVDGRVLTSDRERLTELEGKAIVRAYMNISSPLRQLTLGNTGLARFHAEFAYPWAWTDVTGAWLEWRDLGDEYLVVSRRELEEFAERYVMGDRYEEVDPGNRELLDKSMWQFWALLFH